MISRYGIPRNNIDGWKRPIQQFGRFLPNPKHIDMAGRTFAGGRHAKTAVIVKFKQILFRFGSQTRLRRASPHQKLSRLRSGRARLCRAVGEQFGQAGSPLISIVQLDVGLRTRGEPRVLLLARRPTISGTVAGGSYPIEGRDDREGGPIPRVDRDPSIQPS